MGGIGEGFALAFTFLTCLALYAGIVLGLAIVALLGNLSWWWPLGMIGVPLVLILVVGLVGLLIEKKHG